jgi:ABC-type multidrug transport system fused ATPase/permease subunit
LVGKSGSGKTTVVRLITRLYAAQGGSVLVNGIDVRDIKLKSLRSRIVLVLQEPVIFHATFRENLSYGNPSADRTRLEEAAILTGLEEVVQKSPSGWNEVIGPRGSSLSAGQRQLVAVARAILQQPSILILDEATSALDADTEYKLIEKLDKTLLGTTVILISHRPFVAWWANRILVLDDGQIVEEGKHSALLELGGMYRSIYEKHSRHLFPLIRGRI